MARALSLLGQSGVRWSDDASPQLKILLNNVIDYSLFEDHHIYRVSILEVIGYKSF